MSYPQTIQDIIDGGTPDPDDFIYGNGAPSASAAAGTLYVNLDNKDVWVYSTGAAFDQNFSADTDAGTASWVLIWNFGSNVNMAASAGVVVGSSIARDLTIIRGDTTQYEYFFQNLCWTHERPADNITAALSNGSPDITATAAPSFDMSGRTVRVDGVPNGTTVVSTSGAVLNLSANATADASAATVEVEIPDPVSTDPLNINRLAVPWQQRYWFSEIRDTYVSTIRYHNGYVPWYGTWPNWVWWDTYSLAGAFICIAEYDPVRVGTKVTMLLTSEVARDIRASKNYYWDLESARPVDSDTFDTINTWVRGRCGVLNDWTQYPNYSGVQR